MSNCTVAEDRVDLGCLIVVSVGIVVATHPIDGLARSPSGAARPGGRCVLGVFCV